MSIVSVIIPAYNQGHYLAEAVQSVFAQTHQDFEIVIVDDGSTDDTRQVAAQFENDSRVRYIYQENSGLSAARNTGMRAASGEFVSFLDSDDLFLPNKLTVLLSRFHQNPEVGLVAGQAIFIDEHSRQFGQSIKTGWPAQTADLLLGNPVHVGSVLVRRSWLHRVEPFDESLRACEDWDMWLRLAIEGCLLEHVPQPVSLYRVHRSQMTRDTDRMRTAMLTVLDKTYALANLPASWQAMRNRAYAATLVRAAARAYHAAEIPSAKRDLAEAIRLNSSLLDNNASELLTHLVAWAYAPMSTDPLDYLERVCANLPDNMAQYRNHCRPYLGQMAIDLAFHAYSHGRPIKTRSLVWRALFYWPKLMTNRGVWSIIARSIYWRSPGLINQ